MIELIILGDPKSQKRHRSTRIGGFTRQYDPSAADKKDFLSIVQNNAPEVPFDFPLFVDLEFHFSRPKNHFGTGSKSEILKANAPEWHTSKMDVDNLMKLIFDALNKVYWKDDGVICRCHVIKKYSDKPRTIIRIYKQA